MNTRTFESNLKKSMKQKIEGGELLNNKNMTEQQTETGEWVLAKPVPYYPNVFEKIRHWLGFHIYPNMNNLHPKADRRCLICNKYTPL